MPEEKDHNFIRIIVSIIAGAITTAITFFILIYFFLAAGLFGWSDGGDPKYLERLEFTTKISVILSALVALVTGIFVAIKINKFKK